MFLTVVSKLRPFGIMVTPATKDSTEQKEIMEILWEITQGKYHVLQSLIIDMLTHFIPVLRSI